MSQSRAEKTALQRARRAGTRDESVPLAGGEKTSRIDLGLALLELLCRPGIALSQEDIAAWCGCTHTAIFQLERTALRNFIKKLRCRRDSLEADLLEEYFNRRAPSARQAQLQNRSL